MVFFQAGPLGFGIAFRVFLQPKYLPDFPLGSANIISTTLPIGFATFYALFEKDLPLTAWELPGQHAKAQQAWSLFGPAAALRNSLFVLEIKAATSTHSSSISLSINCIALS